MLSSHYICNLCRHAIPPTFIPGTFEGLSYEIDYSVGIGVIKRLDDPTKAEIHLCQRCTLELQRDFGVANG